MISMTFLLYLRGTVHLEPLIRQLTSVRDPSRTDLVYVPNLGAFSWNHDSCRLVQPHIMIIAINIIESFRNNLTPDEVLLAFYATNVGEVNYTVSEFFGGWYRLENANRINMAVEELFNPVDGRALTNRPSLAKIRVAAANLGPVLNCNPYSAIFNMTGDHLAPLSAMTGNISKFIESAKQGSKALLHISGDASGISCLSLSLEPRTLPTWHKMHIATHPRPALVQNVECTAATNPFQVTNLMHTLTSTPPALYFQPYDRSSSTLNYTSTLGIKTESGQLDGVSLPTPCVKDHSLAIHHASDQVPFQYPKYTHAGTTSGLDRTDGCWGYFNTTKQRTVPH